MSARSSTGQSIGLRIRGLGVRIPSGAPTILPINRILSVPGAFYLFRPDAAIFDHLLAPELAPSRSPVLPREPWPHRLQRGPNHWIGSTFACST